MSAEGNSRKRKAAYDRTEAAVPGGGEREQYYQKAADYWDNVDATIDGVLGGFGHLTEVDIRDSDKFLQSLPHIAGKGVQPGSLACDCGAGIGRVSKDLLLKYCEKVDIVEQCAKYTAAAGRYVGEEHVREIFTQGLQDFDPAPQTYDIIWVRRLTPLGLTRPAHPARLLACCRTGPVGDRAPDRSGLCGILSSLREGTETGRIYWDERK
jgi:protein N-terminal methyltransferase